jgi:integrase
MHQLWQHPNGTFYILYGPRLRRRVSTREKDRGRAESFLAQYIAGTANPVVDAPTVGEILAAYEKDRETEVRGKDGLRFSVRAITERLGTLQPRHLTPATIKNYARQRGRSDGTVLREIGVLRAALGWAVEHQWMPASEKPIISNPVAAPAARDRWLTKDEAKRLLDACKEPHIRLFVLLGLMTVPRMGALLEARWSQVDLELKRIDYGIGHGNKRRAIVPLNDEVAAALTAAKALADFTKTEYVINYRGEPIATVKKGFGAACKRAAIKGVTPHILRHSGATWMALEGVPVREIARMLGDSERTTERVYAKHHPDYLKNAAAALQLQSAAPETPFTL